MKTKSVKNLEKDKDRLKAIDPATLETILGGVRTPEGDAKDAAVIPQSPFSSFYHS